MSWPNKRRAETESRRYGGLVTERRRAGRRDGQMAGKGEGDYPFWKRIAAFQRSGELDVGWRWLERVVPGCSRAQFRAPSVRKPKRVYGCRSRGGPDLQGGSPVWRHGSANPSPRRTIKTASCGALHIRNSMT